jgi:hypothetical protein
LELVRDQGITFDHLTPEDFEQLCYDLLQDLGFVEVNWRKGTPRPSSPADQGRDIEAKYPTKGPGDLRDFDKWFVECKHYTSGVPAEAFDALLSWAQAEDPDNVLIITSGFLSNSAKNHLELYKEKRRPRFRLVTWEKPKLQELLSQRRSLREKYHIGGSTPSLNHIHPAHVRFIRELAHNSLNQLFEQLDSLEPADRNNLLAIVTIAVIKPRVRRPREGKESFAELAIDRIDYPAFKAKCRFLAEFVEEPFLVHSIVSAVLNEHYRLADSSELDASIETQRRAIQNATKLLRSGSENADLLRTIINEADKTIEELPRRTAERRKTYELFCESVVDRLLNNPLPIPTRLEDFPFID